MITKLEIIVMPLDSPKTGSIAIIWMS